MELALLILEFAPLTSLFSALLLILADVLFLDFNEGNYTSKVRTK